MMNLVAKFGGSSLSCARQFRRVREIIQANQDRNYVVPSAPGKRHADDEKITDLLLACQAAAQKQQPIDGIWDKITGRYREIIEELGLTSDIDGALLEVHDAIAAGCTKDYAASRGEYLCGILLAEYLGFAFVDAADLIKFKEDGLWDEKATRAAFSAYDLPAKAVIPGFYGANPDGSVRTFSRGGSDVTGAIVAMLVDAKVYENWTDVSGICMADPRIVENPKIIPYITYMELRELSYMGASVLHEDAIFPVRKVGIPVNVRNTNEPQQPGTMIVPILPKGVKAERVTGIAGRKGFAVIGMEKDMMNAERGFGRKVLSVLEADDISFEHMPTGIDTLSLVIEQSCIAGKEAKVIEDIIDAVHPDTVEMLDNIAIIATVGQGMIRQVGIAARIFAALAKEHINIRMIDQGSSELNILIGVEEPHFERAIQAIYQELAQ